MLSETDLISTTALKHGILPELFASAGSRMVRAWVPRCAAGRDAYWIAMLLNDYIELHGLSNDVRVFATDTEIEQLLPARMGLYEGDAALEKDEARLRRYLQPSSGGGLRVAKRIRDCLLFSKHDILEDPPFSNLDLILADVAFEELPRKRLGDLLQTLHYALAPGGFLLLSPELSPAEMTSYFHVVEAGIFRVRTDRPSSLPPSRRAAVQSRSRDLTETRRPPRTAVSTTVERVLLQEYVPPCIVVSDQGHIVYSVGRTGRYLQTPAGVPTNRLSGMLRPELRPVVMPLLELPLDADGKLSGSTTLRLEGADIELQIFVHVIGALEPQRRLRALVFQETPRPNLVAASNDVGTAELRSQLESLRASSVERQDEYRASSEELATSNEELSSLNEELEASNDELTRIKDEMHGVNEELETVNAELKLKLDEVERAHQQTRSLFEGTRVATLFLDEDLRIGSFTPVLDDLFGLIPADRGRPLADIAQKFRYPDLLGDAVAVMRSGQPLDGQVQSFSGRWYVLRILPFSSVSSDATGVVMTFSDVTALKLAELAEERRHEAELRESQAAAQRELERQIHRTERLISLGTFATGIAHELNNPLATIALSADYAVQTSDPERRAKMLENVRENARRCGRIVESVLHLARDEATERWPSELYPIIRKAAELVTTYPECEKLEIVLNLPETKPRIDCNQTEIEQVFVNLLKNAAQANAARCVVEISSEVHEGFVRVTVADNGRGIPESERERVFDPFFSTRRAVGGTGLGLSLTHRIVSTHGGSIRVVNGTGPGAVFAIELPLSAR